MKKEEPKLTVNLYEFCTIYLGGADSRSLESIIHLVEPIEILLKKADTQLFFIQHPSPHDLAIFYPVLWSYPKWKESCELWERQKAYSEEQRVLRYILDENVRRVSKALQETEWILLDEEHATPCAYSLVKNKREKAIKLLGVKLVTKKEEL